MKTWATQIKRQDSGFTIVELLIVIVVIAILAAITIVSYNGIQNRSRESALRSELSQASKALEAKKLLNGTGSYPATLADAGVRSTKLTYHYNTRADRYCIDGKDGSQEFSVRSSLLTTAEGPCIMQGLSLWLPMNGSVSDASGNDAAVTAQGGPTPTTGASGKSNGAYAFNGDNQLLVVAGGDSIPSQTERVTISVWAKGVSVGGNDYGYILHRGASNSIGSSVFWIGTNSGTAQNIVSSANGKYAAGVTNVSADASTWHHIVLVYAGGYQTGYVDGVQKHDSNIGEMTNPISGNTFTIGGGPGGYRDYAGAIDDVRVYNRAFTPEEVTQLYSAGAQ